MKDNAVALMSTLGGLVLVGLELSPLFSLENYRQVHSSGGVYLWIATIYVFYLLGVYGISLLLRQTYPRRSRTFEPSFLVLSSGLGCLVSSLLFVWIAFYRPAWQRPWLSILPLLAILSIMLLCTRLGFWIKRRKTAGRQGTLLRLVVPALLIAALFWIYNGDFPTNFASAEARQQWAYTEFTDYPSVVQEIRSCQPLTARLGEIKTVAPTWGRNFTIYDQGSSGHRGEFTLQLIGTKGTGTINFAFHIGTNVYKPKFTQNNKTNVVTCN